jgi:hypothetical protein
MKSPCVHTTQEEINKKVPRRNERDIKDAPEELRKQLTFVLVRRRYGSDETD